MKIFNFLVYQFLRIYFFGYVGFYNLKKRKTTKREENR
jgi:hypothetical protein